uniref:Uncharacterized protein n=1 Tax=Anguilla anguilla TaxID=7936 RepID=A0A0E9WPI8_ANGAN
MTPLSAHQCTVHVTRHYYRLICSNLSVLNCLSVVILMCRTPWAPVEDVWGFTTLDYRG